MGQPGRNAWSHSAQTEQESGCPKDKPCARLFQLLAGAYLDFLGASQRVLGSESWAVWDLELEMKLLLFVLSQNFSVSLKPEPPAAVG